MSQPVDWLHLRHLKTCIWLVVALIHTGSVNLTAFSHCLGVGGCYWVNQIKLDFLHKSLNLGLERSQKDAARRKTGVGT